ncbi:hypothetical protein COCC4DRAFT_58170 [Bipolaris maydis ATCC 48331]|uniref:Rhodopsin domain-containing protein n=2 Tax=Cochliobolus heterostrophus TaxID=5016 RepID=M2UXV6_COCH5|nr:uncharacterized protein COCC4DRAFT_58170 [Bipolaris maydis ATCC 48331]EMD92617.1 hypothetical protein COCHEDRAFT_1213658 [Bipolaris maydis C5]KAJ5022424.1 hypothetical protein J3E73DRAFT_374700 [Bipolaris maydis]ENI08313.1 hypothetical protein COCC4DRAFT_58170 [Bipolaris maydis ATCC 48331]KAJ6272079.1 hypothetical protein PSV08DRAFT_350196 [Bipolaris maydis]KAJ6281832.1 hypothetical protein J3E71DRAFT_342566 [Bipolaris maydis]
MGWAYNTPESAVNSGSHITIVAIVFTVASLLVLSLRFYVRGWMIKTIGADDYVLAFSWVACCGFAVVTILQTKWGLGLKNVSDMPNENIFNFGLLQYIGAPFYITSIMSFKISLMLTYLRFMPKGAARTATIVVIVLCILFHLAFLIIQLNLCHPIAMQWDRTITGTCLPAVPIYTTTSSLTITFDVTVMFLPFPVLLASRIQNRKKIVLLGLLALGTFITIIQVIRIQTIRSLSNYLDSSGVIMWSSIENNLGVIVASIPTLAPLFTFFVDKTVKSSERSSRGKALASKNF